MTERPILFTDPMPQALLREVDPKTQTRRVVARELKNPGWTEYRLFGPSQNNPGRSYVLYECGPDYPDGDDDQVKCPYADFPGDRLWVKETFWAFGRWETRFSQKKGHDEWHFIDMTSITQAGYRFERPTSDGVIGKDRKVGTILPAWWKRPSIFMPRAASRILLEVAAVRVERLQDISEADVLAEGIQRWPLGYRVEVSGAPTHECRTFETATGAYRWLWESINGAGSWALNPHVWVVEFKRIKP